jgi:hypothetical protein
MSDYLNSVTLAMADLELENLPVLLTQALEAAVSITAIPLFQSSDCSGWSRRQESMVLIQSPQATVSSGPVR